MNIAWKVLGGIGVLLILLALGLDTTVQVSDGSRVHNLSRQSQQQTLLILGCVLFLAGVILFGFDRMKSPPGEERPQDRLRIPERSPKEDELAFQKLEAFLTRINPGSDFVPSRLLVGVLLGLIWATMLGDAAKSTPVGMLVFMAVVVGCLLRSPAGTVITRLALLHAAAIAVLIAILSATKGNEQSLSAALTEPRFYVILGLLVGLPSVVAVFLVFRIRRKTGQYRTTTIEGTQMHKGPS